MPLYRGDVLIKELRKARNLTQEQLCEGICEKGTLSRIERGLRRPDWFTFERLMQRLGEDPIKYYTDIVNIEDKQIIDLKEKIHKCLLMKTEEGFKEAETFLIQLEQRGANNLVRQYALYVKASLASHRGQHNKSLSLAVRGIRVTVPHFDEDKIDTYILSMDEVRLINIIAIAYAELSFNEKSLEIQKKLIASMDKSYHDEDEKLKFYVTLLYNTANDLFKLKQYDRCMSMCDKGIRLCDADGFNYTYLPMFLYYKSLCLYRINNIDEGNTHVYRAILLFKGMERYAELDMITKYLEKEFGITLPVI